MELAYDLRTNKEHIKLIQKVSLEKTSALGLKIENNLLFGTPEWFKAVDNGTLRKEKLEGVITRVYMSGHNDYPEFEIETQGGKSQWTRDGKQELYKVGKRIEIIYVEQRFKRAIAILGAISKCVISIKIEP